MEEGLSTRRLVIRLGLSESILKKFWEQWKVAAYMRRLALRRPLQKNRRKVSCHPSYMCIANFIAFTIQTQITPSFPVSVCLYNCKAPFCRILYIAVPITCDTNNTRRLRLEWCRARSDKTTPELNQVVMQRIKIQFGEWRQT